jgi:hypothetical protein
MPCVPAALPVEPPMSKAFASQADLDDKKITFEQLSPHCWAYTTEGDPNSGVIIGDKFIMVSDATATPAMARDLIARIRTVSDKPIKYVLLTHYHAVRVLGASAYFAEGATEIIASQGTYDLIVERGEAGHAVGDGALPAPVPQRRDGARPDLADHGDRRRQPDQGRSARPLTLDLGGVRCRSGIRARPHARRHHRLDRIGEGAVLRRPGGVRTPASTPATPTWRSGRPRWKRCAR